MCSLLMYTNMIEISLLILYPMTLLNSSLRSGFGWVFFFFFLYTSWDFTMWRLCHLKIRTVLFIYSFMVFMPFISFSCIIVLAKTSNTMWKGGVSRHLVVFLILEEKHFLSLVNTMLVASVGRWSSSSWGSSFLFFSDSF